MLKEKTGRVTFMPLNRLKPKNPPAPNSLDAEPLLEKLRFNHKYEKAFQQVFGMMCMCQDLTIAAAYVKSHGINTITLDSDKVDRMGALTGGYHDVRRSLIEAIKNVKTWRMKYDSESNKSQEVKASITKQRDQLLERREELDKSATSIEELVDVLDQRKDEAIERTFKQVASNFEEVFEKLIPAGRGRLIIQRRIDQVSTILFGFRSFLLTYVVR